jgi:hypothetical protein
VISIWERIFSALREDSFRPLVNHFIQLLKKESMRSNTYFSSIPADRIGFINRAKASQLPSLEDVMTLRFVALMRRDPWLHYPIIPWVRQALTFVARSSVTLKPEATTALTQDLFACVKVLSQQNCQAELSVLVQTGLNMAIIRHQSRPMELLGRIHRECLLGIALHEVSGGVRERLRTGAVRCCC